jgi:hypothetical protein
MPAAAELSRDDGWGWTALSKKRHYFRAGVALCGRLLDTRVLNHAPAVNKRSDCWRCKRALAREGAKK